MADIEIMETAQRQRLNVALVGASSLLGKEIRQVIEERRIPIGRLAQIDAPDVQGQLSEFDDEPAVILPVEADTFENVACAIFASSPSFTKEHWGLAEAAGCDIIEMNAALRGEKSARVWAPSLEEKKEQTFTSVPSRLLLSPHPAALALTHLLSRVQRKSSIRRAVVTIFEPVSEQGQAGVDELHQQTLKLLAFQPFPQAVFDAQVAFNLLSRFGTESKADLRHVEDRISSNLSELSTEGYPIPSLRVLQLPVFHGTAFEAFIELEQPVDIEELEGGLRHPPFSLSEDAADSPSPASAAGSNEILVGRIEKDRACASGYWVWGALDNLRFAAMNAVDMLERVLLAQGQADKID